MLRVYPLVNICVTVSRPCDEHVRDEWLSELRHVKSILVGRAISENDTRQLIIDVMRQMFHTRRLSPRRKAFCDIEK